MEKLLRGAQWLSVFTFAAALPFIVERALSSKYNFFSYPPSRVERKNEPTIPFSNKNGVIITSEAGAALNIYAIFYSQYRRIQMSHTRAKEEAVLQVKLRGGRPSIISEEIMSVVRLTYEASLSSI